MKKTQWKWLKCSTIMEHLIVEHFSYFHQAVWKSFFHPLSFVCKLYQLSTLESWKLNNNYIGHSIVIEHFSYFHWTVWKSFFYSLLFVCKFYQLGTLESWKSNNNYINIHTYMHIYIYIYIYNCGINFVSLYQCAQQMLQFNKWFKVRNN